VGGVGWVGGWGRLVGCVVWVGVKAVLRPAGPAARTIGRPQPRRPPPLGTKARTRCPLFTGERRARGRGRAGREPCERRRALGAHKFVWGLDVRAAAGSPIALPPPSPPPSSTRLRPDRHHCQRVPREYGRRSRRLRRRRRCCHRRGCRRCRRRRRHRRQRSEPVDPAPQSWTAGVGARRASAGTPAGCAALGGWREGDGGGSRRRCAAARGGRARVRRLRSTSKKALPGPCAIQRPRPRPRPAPRLALARTRPEAPQPRYGRRKMSRR
jgi:hypothetical protein